MSIESELAEGLKKAGQDNIALPSSMPVEEQRNKAMENLAKPIAEAIEKGVHIEFKGSLTCDEISGLQDVTVGDIYMCSDEGKVGELECRNGTAVIWTEEGWRKFFEIDVDGIGISMEEVSSMIAAAISAEAAARANADTALGGRIDGEATARENADATLQGNIDAEASARESADDALDARIDGEETAREQADGELQAQIDAISSRSDVVDVVASHVELVAYDTSALADNDVIKVLADETHEDAISYYRWSTASEAWSFIGSQGPYYTISEADALLAGKAPTNHASTATTYGEGDATHYGHVKVDSALSASSINPVQNKAVNEALNRSKLEANGLWGGSFRNSWSPTEQAMRNVNCFYGPTPSCVAVEYTNDGGITWLDYGLSDLEKSALFIAENNSISCGKNKHVQPGYTGSITDAVKDLSDSNIQDQRLRITIACRNLSTRQDEDYWLYCRLRRILIYMTTQSAGLGNTHCVLEGLEGTRWKSGEDVWHTFGDYNIQGDSGWNSLPCANETSESSIVFGGGWSQGTGQYWAIRFTIWANKLNPSPNPSQTGCLKIQGIKGLSELLWVNAGSSITTMRSEGVPYRVLPNGTIRFLPSVVAVGDDSNKTIYYKGGTDVSIADGGTGASTPRAAEYNILNQVEDIDTTLDDNRKIALCNQTKSSSNGVFRWIKLSNVWSWILDKLNRLANWSASDLGATKYVPMSDSVSGDTKKASLTAVRNYINNGMATTAALTNGLLSKQDTLPLVSGTTDYDIAVDTARRSGYSFYTSNGSFFGLYLAETNFDNASSTEQLTFEAFVTIDNSSDAKGYTAGNLTMLVKVRGRGPDDIGCELKVLSRNGFYGDSRVQPKLVVCRKTGTTDYNFHLAIQFVDISTLQVVEITNRNYVYVHPLSKFESCTISLDKAYGAIPYVAYETQPIDFSGVAYVLADASNVGSPAAWAKAHFNVMPKYTTRFVYNQSGSEKLLIFAKGGDGYGTIVRIGYDSTAVQLLRLENGTWKSSDWEGVDAHSIDGHIISVGTYSSVPGALSFV